MANVAQVKASFNNSGGAGLMNSMATIPMHAHAVTKEQLTKYFHLPITDVARELGICATMLKKLCRKNGIPRWPFRKIKSIDKMIASLEITMQKTPSEAPSIQRELNILRNKRAHIIHNPEVLVKHKTHARLTSSDEEFDRDLSLKLQQSTSSLTSNSNSNPFFGILSDNNNNSTTTTATITTTRQQQGLSALHALVGSELEEENNSSNNNNNNNNNEYNRFPIPIQSNSSSQFVIPPLRVVPHAMDVGKLKVGDLVVASANNSSPLKFSFPPLTGLAFPTTTTSSSSSSSPPSSNIQTILNSANYSPPTPLLANPNPIISSLFGGNGSPLREQQQQQQQQPIQAPIVATTGNEMGFTLPPLNFDVSMNNNIQLPQLQPSSLLSAASILPRF